MGGKERREERGWEGRREGRRGDGREGEGMGGEERREERGGANFT